MFGIYLIACLILIVIANRLTNKNYREIREMQNYLDICNKVSIEIERVEKKRMNRMEYLFFLTSGIRTNACILVRLMERVGKLIWKAIGAFME